MEYLIYFYDFACLAHKQNPFIYYVSNMLHSTGCKYLLRWIIPNISAPLSVSLWLILSLACNATHFYIFVISTQFTSFHDNLIIVQQHIHFLKVFNPLNPYRFKAILEIIIIVEWNEGHSTLLKLTMGLLKPTMTSNGY